MMSHFLPSVLQGNHDKESSISMERALKQILTLLEQMSAEGTSNYDYIEASIDDTKMMLAHIDRG